MHVAVLTGFLGSGKTTLLKAVSVRLASEGQRVAIIVNEVGSVDCQS